MSSADATPSSAPSRLSRSSFFILITGLLANAIGQAFIFAILPPLGREVALSEVQTTSIISTSALVFTFCSPWWGRRSDQIGRKIVIVIGLTGYAVGTVIFAGVFALGMKGILSGVDALLHSAAFSLPAIFCHGRHQPGGYRLCRRP
jgi:MFS family permease